MAKRSRTTFKKRQREMARQQKQQDKVARRQATKEVVPATSSVPPNEDPDLAGIVAGPQPLPEEVREFLQNSVKEEEEQL